jgi:hypothetical protein
MNVIKPLMSIDVRHLASTLRISNQKNAVAAIMAIEPTKNVNATFVSSDPGLDQIVDISSIIN